MLLLGSNLGDRGGFINKALAYIEAAHGVEMIKLSSIVETSPLGEQGPGSVFLMLLLSLDVS